MATSQKNFSYDESVAEIEKILDDLQNNESLPFDDMIANVEKAVALLKQCKTKLTEVDKKLNALFEND